jgi:hypothetical protein
VLVDASIGARSKKKHAIPRFRPSTLRHPEERDLTCSDATLPRYKQPRREERAVSVISIVGL